MDSGKVTILVLLDLSSAFDCIDKFILFDILRHMGIRGSALAWLVDYLSNRTQSVTVRMEASQKMPVTFGVPQGSVLGPLLFSIYLTGLRDVISKHNIPHIVYADDIQLFISATPQLLSTSIRQIEDCIRDIFEWLCSMKLMLNAKKTEVILLGSDHALSKCQFPGINVCGNLILPSKHVKSLGVILDCNLSMALHVNKIRASSFSRIKLIARVRKNLNQKRACLLVKTLVLPHIYYCVSLLAGINTTLIMKLQRIVNSSIRLVHRIHKYNSIPQSLAQAQWPPVEVLIKLGTMRILFGVLKYSKPTFLHSLVSAHSSGRGLRSDEQSLLAIPRTHRTAGDRAFRVFGPRLWNSLPELVKRQLRYDTFLAECMKFFLSSD